MVSRDFELPPLVRALLDSFVEGVVVFSPDGRVAFANEPARRAVASLGNGSAAPTDLRAQLVAAGGRITPLRAGTGATAEAIFLPMSGGRTLAERERQAILDTLQGTSGKLAETARRLGISRTTLWRRLRAYGIDRHVS